MVILETQRKMRSEQFTQEFQALGNAFNDRLSYIVGLYYLHDNGSQNDPTNVIQGLWRASPPFTTPAGVVLPHNPGFDLSRNYSDTQQTESYAAFGQATHHLASNLALTAGLRYTSETKHASISVQSPESGIVYVPQTALSDTWTALTPRLALDYQVSTDVMLYGSVSKGFKSGGFNGRPSNIQSLSEIDPETVWSYELGAKSEWFQHRLRGNLAIFDSHYKNIQLSRQLLLNGVIVSDIRNVAGATVEGFEFELTALPLRGLEVRASAGYTYNKYTAIQANAPVFPTSKIPYAPEKTANVSVRYELPVGAAGTLSAGAGYSYRSDTYSTPSNTAISYLPSYGLVDARIAYQPASSFWDVAVYGTNLSNKRYLNSVGDASGVGLAQLLYGRPREVGATINVRF
jgi:iron complex outermembrane receptor protein